MDTKKKTNGANKRENRLEKIKQKTLHTLEEIIQIEEKDKKPTNNKSK